MISTNYDVEEDALYVRIAPTGAKVVETREVEPGIILDLDSSGRVIGIEVLRARARSAEPARAA